MITFNADEVFEMAEQIERNGARYYRRVAECLRDPYLQTFLLGLAAMEDEHERRFAAMRADLDETRKQPSVFDPEGEAALYLRAMADERVFDLRVDPAAQVTGKETAEEILQQAIGMEKNSILFYMGLRDMVPSGAGKKEVEDIIHEEMTHVTKLGAQLAALPH